MHTLNSLKITLILLPARSDVTIGQTEHMEIRYLVIIIFK